jgi:glycosyltransferase involved in cell wall biosynthesis
VRAALGQAQRDDADMSPPPAVSVVVPTRDRPRQLRACISALARLEPLDGGLEVIIANDGGTPPTEALEEGRGLELSVVESAGRGPAAARNVGAARARGSLVAFTDDDCAPEPVWAVALLRRHLAQPDALIGGPTMNALPGNPYSRAAQAIADAALAHHNADPGTPRLLPSSNVAAPAALFQEIGGFDERVAKAGGEDFELCNRWGGRGWSLAWEPEATVLHSHPLSLIGFWRQQSAYGAGALFRRRARAHRGGRFELQPSATSGILSIAVRRALAERDPARFALIALWQIANLSGFTGAALRSRLGGAP